MTIQYNHTVDYNAVSILSGRLC